MENNFNNGFIDFRFNALFRTYSFDIAFKMVMHSKYLMINIGANGNDKNIMKLYVFLRLKKIYNTTI